MKFITVFFQQFRKIFICSAVLILLYTICRLLFWNYNRNYFLDYSAVDAIKILYCGLQQDIASLLLLNAPILLILFAGSFSGRFREMVLPFGQWAFVITNISGFAINILDIGYFSYTRHRSNLSLRYVISDSLSSVGSILSKYWLLISGFILIIFLVYRLGRFLFRKPEKNLIPGARTILLNQVIFIFLVWFLMKGFKPGIILPSTPLLSVAADKLPIAQNSVYTFAYSVLKRQEQFISKKYFSEAALESMVVSVHRMTHAVPMNHKNVIICILESFSRGYLVPGDFYKAKTPFFDSLIKKSIFFPNAFANGFESNQGIVAILGGLPAFLDEPFYYSIYANTPLHSIGNILKEKGYSTHFFMGANRDHFGFEKFGRMAGIDHFHDRVDFNNDRFYDGNWGIFDEPFLQFGSGILASQKEPFLAVFFNISSHPPFTLPDNRKKDFSIPGQTAAQNSISYVDHSYSLFFETCKKAAWFRNSIFVFCADHALVLEDGMPYTTVTASQIPIFIYSPDSASGGINESVLSQVDITPSLLGLLGYSGTYSGFGRNVFDSANGSGYAFNKPGSLFQIIDSSMAMGYDVSREKVEFLYRYHENQYNRRNLTDSMANSAAKKKLENQLKAVIQRYRESLTRRSLE